MTALMQHFNPAGRWSSTLGWQDANALTSVIDYLQRSGNSTYAWHGTMVSREPAVL